MSPTILFTQASMYGEERPCWGVVHIGCPGCGGFHTINIAGENGDLPPSGRPYWEWDGNEETPTFSPSILSRAEYVGRRQEVCHSFFRNGRWEFLSDCTHRLAGQTADPIPLPDWMCRED